MAPKKEVSGPTPDLNPYGAFLNVSVSHTELELEAPAERVASAKPAKPAGKGTGQTPEPGAPPKTHLVVTYPGSYAPSTGTPTDLSDASTFKYSFTERSRREPGPEALHELINGSVRIAVCESVSGAQLATAAIDPLAFALGETSIDLGSVTLTPEATAPAGCPTVKSGTLQGVKLWLTHRAKAVADAAAGSRPGTGTGERPKGSASKAANGADAYPPESELPPVEPYSFIPAEQKNGANVIELSIGAIQPLPAGLAATVAAATEGKAGGKVGFTCGLPLPAGPTVILAGGSLVAGGEGGGDSVVWQPSRVRYGLTGEQIAALLECVEDGAPLKIELARYIASEAIADTAWAAYHAEAVIPGTAALLRPGATTTPPSPAPLQPYTADATTGSASCLPAYTAPQSKATKPVDDPTPAGACAWAVAGSALASACMTLARPLIPPWAPPPPVAAPLAALIPPRAPQAPHTTPTAAVQQFRRQIQTMAEALTQLQLSGAVPAGADNAAALATHLESDGRLQQLRAAVKKSVIAVALEQQHTDLDGRPLTSDQADKVLKQLHSQLELAIAEVVPHTDTQDTAAHAGHDTQLGRLLSLANECETVGDVQRAAKLHQERVVLCVSGEEDSGAKTAEVGGSNPDQGVSAEVQAGVWYEYGCFCMRQGVENRGRAMEAFKKAFSVCGEHERALAALTAGLLEEGLVTDKLYLTEASQTASHLITLTQQRNNQPPTTHTNNPTKVNKGGALAWGLSLLICQASGEQAKSDTMAAALAGLQQAEKNGLDTVRQRFVRGADAADVNGLLAVAELAVALALPDVTAMALEQAGAELPASWGMRIVEGRADVAAARGWAARHAQAQADADRAADAAADAEQRALLAADALAAARAIENPDEAAAAAVAAAAAAADAATSTATAAAQAAKQTKEAADDAAHHVMFAHFLADGPGAGTESYLLRGEVLYRTRQLRECVSAYVFAVNRAHWPGVKVPLRAYLQLADCYMQLGQPQDAANVYQQACIAFPCASAWLGLSRAHTALSEVTLASQALTQASRCDPESPVVWGELAAAALRAGRVEEASVHASTALRLGLTHLPLLVTLCGEAHTNDNTHGNTDTETQQQQALPRDVVRMCLERAVKQRGAPAELRVRLVQMCLDDNDVASARSQLQAAVLAAKGHPALESRVNALVPRVLDAQTKMFIG